MFLSVLGLPFQGERGSMSEISKMLIWRRIFIPSRDASDGISQKFSVLPTQGNIRTTDLREEACIYLRCVSWH